MGDVSIEQSTDPANDRPTARQAFEKGYPSDGRTDRGREECGRCDTGRYLDKRTVIGLLLGGRERWREGSCCCVVDLYGYANSSLSV